MLIFLTFVITTQFIPNQYTYTYTGYTNYIDLSVEDRNAEFCVSLFYCLRCYNGIEVMKSIPEINNTSKSKSKSKSKMNKDISVDSKITTIIDKVVRVAVLHLVRWTCTEQKERENIEIEINNFFRHVINVNGQEYNCGLELSANFARLEKCNSVKVTEIHTEILYDIVQIVEVRSRTLESIRMLIYNLYCLESNSSTCSSSKAFNLYTDKIDQTSYLNFINNSFKKAEYKDSINLRIVINIQRYYLDLFLSIKAKFQYINGTLSHLEMYKQSRNIILHIFKYFDSSIGWHKTAQIESISDWCYENDLPTINLVIGTHLTKEHIMDSFHFHLANLYVIKNCLTDLLSLDSLYDWLVSEFTRVFVIEDRPDKLKTYLKQMQNNLDRTTSTRSHILYVKHTYYF